MAVIAACSVSKDHNALAVAMPASFEGKGKFAEVSLPADSQGISALSYKKFFKDPLLQDLIDTALMTNSDMQLAVKNIEAASLVLRQSRQGNLPDLSVMVTATTTRPSDNSLNGLSINEFLGRKHIEDFTAAASLSWEADIWGKIRSRTSAALAAYLQTGEAKKAVQVRLVSNIATGYYNLLMLDKQLSVAQRNLSLNDSTLNIIKLQYSSGQVTSLAVQQAEAQKLAAAQLVPAYEREIAVQEHALNVLLGGLPERMVRRGSLDAVALPEALSAGLPSVVVSARPDVRQWELDVRRANANVSFTKAAMYPSLTISAQGGLNAIKASNWFSIPASLFASAVGSVTQPVFQRRQLRTQYELAKNDREQSVIQFRQSVLQAVGEVEDALTELEKYRQEQQLAVQRTATLQKAIANAKMLYSAGMANYLEIITAQGNVLQSELDLAEIKRNRMEAVADLYRSVGGGWQ